MGVPWVDAPPSEAEAQCAELLKKGKVIVWHCFFIRFVFYLDYSVIHISIHPSKELFSKMAPGEIGGSLP